MEISFNPSDFFMVEQVQYSYLTVLLKKRPCREARAEEARSK